MKKRSKLSAGEIRFRVSKVDLERIEWLLAHSNHYSVSDLLRTLIFTATTGEPFELLRIVKKSK